MKRLAILLATTLSLGLLMRFCGSGDDEVTTHESQEATVADVVPGDTITRHRLHVNYMGSYSRVFNDLNAEHLEVAQRIGIKPVSTLYDAYNIEKPIMHITTCDDFKVSELTHSLPYLVPQAARLLHDLGRSFSDSVMARGGKKYKIVVTSVTRTDYTVTKLRRSGNVNATVESAHRYGTTFDVSYRRFECCDSSFMVAPQDLEGILAEVLRYYRNQGRCLVKYEVKQGCFHITAID